MNEEALRIFNLNLKEKVAGVWDENIPIIRHMVVECVGVEGQILSDGKLLDHMKDLCDNLDLHVVKTFVHTFEPQGTTVLMVLEESHIAVHSWPEKGYCHIDLVTCSKAEQNLLKLAKAITDIFKSKSIRIINLKY